VTYAFNNLQGGDKKSCLFVFFNLTKTVNKDEWSEQRLIRIITTFIWIAAILANLTTVFEDESRVNVRGSSFSLIKFSKCSKWNIEIELIASLSTVNPPKKQAKEKKKVENHDIRINGLNPKQYFRLRWS
jgi:hypothetical protein